MLQTSFFLKKPLPHRSRTHSTNQQHESTAAPHRRLKPFRNKFNILSQARNHFIKATQKTQILNDDAVRHVTSFS
jgi:hypothetical protein